MLHTLIHPYARALALFSHLAAPRESASHIHVHPYTPTHHHPLIEATLPRGSVACSLRELCSRFYYSPMPCVCVYIASVHLHLITLTTLSVLELYTIQSVHTPTYVSMYISSSKRRRETERAVQLSRRRHRVRDCARTLPVCLLGLCLAPRQQNRDCCKDRRRRGGAALSRARFSPPSSLSSPLSPSVSSIPLQVEFRLRLGRARERASRAHLRSAQRGGKFSPCAGELVKFYGFFAALRRQRARDREKPACVCVCECAV